MNNQKLRNFLLYLSLLLPLPAFAAGETLDTGIMEDEPLPPEQAFILSTEVLSADMIRAKWHIVDGHRYSVESHG